MADDLAQFKLKLETRKRLRDFKTKHYDDIKVHMQNLRDFVSYDDVINYMLDKVKG